MLIPSKGRKLFQILIWLSWNTFCIATGDMILTFNKEPISVMDKPGPGRANFRCSATPARASIEWLQNGQPIMDDADGIFRIQDGERLTVKLPKKLEESGPGRPFASTNMRNLIHGGLYLQCLARFKGQALISKPARLIVAEISSFANETDIHLTVILGNTAFIPCSPPYSVPNAVTEFEFNGMKIDRTKDRYLLHSSGNLEITNAQLNDSGEYHCIAHNPFLEERRRAKHRVHLHVKDEKRQMAASFTNFPHSSKTVVTGSNVTLECSAQGYPIPNITWHKKLHRLPSHRNSQLAGNLLLFGVRKGDEGTYVCTASNLLGNPVMGEIFLEVQEPPQILKTSPNKKVTEGESVTFDCVTKGRPKPVVMWFHNGAKVQEHSRITIKESKIILHHVKHHHGGIYQCFASNELGAIYAASHLTVISNHNTSNSSLPDEKPHKHKHAEKGKKGRKHKGVKMVPPTRPFITRLSEDSVMVRWDVPSNDGLPIQFFKVQYKEVGTKKDIWNTIDDDIAAHIFSYAVTGLKAGGKYRFRIAAVYSNYDNKDGPKSPKFTLYKDPPMKKPTYGPNIIYAEPTSPSAITLNWDYMDIDLVPIDGFFIYYRATHSAGEYLKITVMGSNTRFHIISHLLPETSYDMKMQCFNSAGTSEFSNIYTSKTKPSEYHQESDGKIGRTKQETSNERGLKGSSKNSTNKLLYIILGVALTVMVIVLVIFLFLCLKRRRHQRDRVVAQNVPVPKITSNGNGAELNGYLRPRPQPKINISVNPLAEVESDKQTENIYLPQSRQYQEVPSNNNEVILLNTLDRSSARNARSSIHSSADNEQAREQQHKLLPGDDSVEIQDSAT